MDKRKLNNFPENLTTKGAPAGNHNASTGRQLTAMLTHALEANDKQALRDGIKKIAEDFAAGDKSTRDFVFDRLEGKSVQTTNVNITKHLRELTDEQLLAIASGNGVVSETESEASPTKLH